MELLTTGGAVEKCSDGPCSTSMKDEYTVLKQT